MPIQSQIEKIVDLALAEDLAGGDITTETLIRSEQRGTASILAKSRGILAGTEVAKQVFHRVDRELKVDILYKEGAQLEPGNIIAKVEGNITAILKAERVALNFLQRLSGIATETNRYVEAVKGLPVKILDTRKTTPGLRALEKYAVRVGGGENHRMNLSDSILIKDTHLVALYSQGLDIREIIARAQQNASSQLKVEIEVRTIQEAAAAAEAGADIIMLDNMSLADMRHAVKMIQGRASTEASGGITLDRIRAVAKTGVNFISIGALTHSVRALDISLELTASKTSLKESC